MTRTEAFKVFMQGSEGQMYHVYDIIDDLVREAMQENIKYMLGPEADEFETPDNVAKDLSAFYTVLKYYSTQDQYQTFLKEVSG